jgi:hypothetical protein
MPIEFTVTINHCFPDGKSPAGSLADLLSAMENRILSTLTDDIGAVKASLDAMESRVTAKEDALQGMITSLQGVVATLQQQATNGGASQADLDALNAIKGQLDSFQADQPEPSPTPTPGP